MNAQEVKRQYHLSKWRPIVQECRTSGMTVRAWCKENNVSEQQFFYWQHRLREELCTAIQIPKKDHKPTIFAPISVQNHHKETLQSSPFIADLVISFVITGWNLRIEPVLNY
jgi:transposase-like protein